MTNQNRKDKRQDDFAFQPSLRALLVAAPVAMGLIAAPAFAAQAASPQTIVLQSHLYNMPAGAAPAPAPKANAEAPIRIPIGEAKLFELKKQSSAASPVSNAGATQVKESIPGQPGQMGVVAVNCSNLGAATIWAPSDSNGAVSGTAIVTVKNASVGVYGRGCGLKSNTDLNAFFGGAVPSGQTLFDPRIVFDRGTGRFFLTADSADFSGATTDQYQFFAVSKDATGMSWYEYVLPLSISSSGFLFCKAAQNSFWDYPMAGFSNGLDPSSASGQGRWFITANDFGASVVGDILSIDMAASYKGGGLTIKCFRNLPFNLATPIVLDHSTVDTFLSPGSGGGSTIARLNLTASTSGAGGDTLASIASVIIPSWAAPPAAMQPNGQLLDSLDGRFQWASIQSRGELWNVHSIGLSSRSRIRMYKLAQAASSTSPQLIFTPATSSGEDLFNPSVATASGAFNAPAFVSASRTIRSIQTITGNATALMFSGLNSSTSSLDWTYNILRQSPSQFTGCSPVCRWGDYSSTQVDPLASGSAWGFNQIATGTTMWNWTLVGGEVNLNLTSSPVAGGQ